MRETATRNAGNRNTLHVIPEYFYNVILNGHSVRQIGGRYGLSHPKRQGRSLKIKIKKAVLPLFLFLLCQGIPASGFQRNLRVSPRNKMHSFILFCHMTDNCKIRIAL